MSQAPRRKRWHLLLVVALSALALAGGAVASQRGALLSWHYAHQLKRAPEGEQQQWVAKLVSAGEPAVPRLLALLQQDDAALCDAARSGLEQLCHNWGPKDEKSARLADRFFEMHPSFSPTGQIAALQLLPEVRRTLARIDNNIPVLNVSTLTEQVDRSMAQEDLISKLSTFFSLLALLLACIGVYGAMTYNVVRRAREIGIRMALGAKARGVLWMVLKETLMLLAGGVAVGVPIALVAMRAVKSQLFGLSPSDPMTILVAAVAIALVTVIAGYIPARRATQVDPLVALRYE